MSAWVWVGVALLGGVGAIARFVVEGVLSSRFPGSFPLGTFVVNISGATALGLLAGLALTGNALVLAGGATLGSYTTFSAWMLESQRLNEDEKPVLALVNIVGSLVLGLGGVALGHAIGARV